MTEDRLTAALGLQGEESAASSTGTGGCVLSSLRNGRWENQPKNCCTGPAGTMRWDSFPTATGAIPVGIHP